MARVQLLVTTVVATKDQSLAEVKNVRVAMDPSVDSASQVDAAASVFLNLSELGKERTWMAVDAHDGFDISKSNGRKQFRLREDAGGGTDVEECDDEPIDDFIGALNGTLTTIELINVVKEGQKVAEEVRSMCDTVAMLS
jgi:hypothetical protein